MAQVSRRAKIPFAATLALGTLADGAVLSVGVAGATFGEHFTSKGIRATWTLRDMTAGDEPVTCGLSHGDLSDAEVAEATDAIPMDRDDIIANEQAKRPVRKVGTFIIQEASGDEVLNNGMPIWTPFKWAVGIGHFIDAWAQNRSGSALQSGSVLEVLGYLYGEWK